MIKEDKALLSFGRRWWSVSPRSSVSLCEKAHPPPTTHQSFHPRRRRRRHPTKKKTKGCSVLFRSFSDRQTEHKRTVDDDPRENLIISLKNCRRFLPALTVVSLSRSIHQRRSLKNTLGSLRTEEEEGE